MLALVGSAIAGSSGQQRTRKQYGGKRVTRQQQAEAENQAPAKSVFDLSNMQMELKKLAQMISSAANPGAEEEQEHAECKLQFRSSISLLLCKIASFLCSFTYDYHVPSTDVILHVPNNHFITFLRHKFNLKL